MNPAGKSNTWLVLPQWSHLLRKIFVSCGVQVTVHKDSSECTNMSHCLCSSKSMLFNLIGDTVQTDDIWWILEVSCVLFP